MQSERCYCSYSKLELYLWAFGTFELYLVSKKTSEEHLVLPKCNTSRIRVVMRYESTVFTARSRWERRKVVSGQWQWAVAEADRRRERGP